MRYREGHGPKGVPKAFTSQATLGLLPAQDFLRFFFYYYYYTLSHPPHEQTEKTLATKAAYCPPVVGAAGRRHQGLKRWEKTAGHAR